MAGPRRAGGGPAPRAGYAGPIPERQPRRSTDRTQALIDRGRRTARRPRSRRGYKIAIGTAAGLVVLVIGAMIVLRKGPSWPPSVATVRSEITTACQNPNVASEPSQVNFACGKDTSQILWVFALMTSNNNPGYADAKTGRKGLEPITRRPGRPDRLVAEPASSLRPAQPGRQPGGGGAGHQQHHRRGDADRRQRQAHGPAGSGEQAGELRQVHRIAGHHLARRVPQPVRQPGDQPGRPGGARRATCTSGGCPAPPRWPRRTRACCSRTPATPATRRCRPSSRPCRTPGSKDGNPASAAGDRAGEPQHLRSDDRIHLRPRHGRRYDVTGERPGPPAGPGRAGRARLATSRPRRPRRTTVRCGRRSSAWPGTTCRWRRARRRPRWRR